MKFKYLFVAAAICTSAGVSAQSPASHGRAAMTAPAAATAQHAVLDNIIGRVQMDALISTIVSSDVPPATAKPVSLRRNANYASVASRADRGRG